jgi:hypothetical protein
VWSENESVEARVESFLARESEAWAPYEALFRVPDDVLGQAAAPDGPLGTWKGRDLLVHMASVTGGLVAVAKELQVSSSSRLLALMYTEWNQLGAEAYNARVMEKNRDVPTEVVRERLRAGRDDFHRQLRLVPVGRWIKDTLHYGWFFGDSIAHYDSHTAQLKELLSMAGLLYTGIYTGDRVPFYA